MKFNFFWKLTNRILGVFHVFQKLNIFFRSLKNIIIFSCENYEHFEHALNQKKFTLGRVFFKRCEFNSLRNKKHDVREIALKKNKKN